MYGQPCSTPSFGACPSNLSDQQARLPASLSQDRFLQPFPLTNKSSALTDGRRLLYPSPQAAVQSFMQPTIPSPCIITPIVPSQRPFSYRSPRCQRQLRTCNKQCACTRGPAGEITPPCLFRLAFEPPLSLYCHLSPSLPPQLHRCLPLPLVLPLLPWAWVAVARPQSARTRPRQWW